MANLDQQQTNGGTNVEELANRVQVVSLQSDTMAPHELKEFRDEIYHTLSSSMVPVPKQEFVFKSGHSPSFFVLSNAHTDNFSEYQDDRLSDGSFKIPHNKVVPFRANQRNQGTTSVGTFDEVSGRSYNPNVSDEDANRSIRHLGFEGDLNHDKSSRRWDHSGHSGPSRGINGRLVEPCLAL